MASKADLLKRGANKTGKGLFAGMTPISEENEVKQEAKVEEIKNNKSEVVEESKKSEPIVETVIEKIQEPEMPKPVAQEKPENRKAEPTPIEMVEEILKTGDAAKAKAPVSEKAEKPEKASRYEKEKFLLLDIRGYRDYVEHMAKAANMSATKYIRSLIEQDMKQNMDIYEAHKALEERLKERK